MTTSVKFHTSRVERNSDSNYISNKKTRITVTILILISKFKKI